MGSSITHPPVSLSPSLCIVDTLALTCIYELCAACVYMTFCTLRYVHSLSGFVQHTHTHTLISRATSLYNHIFHRRQIYECIFANGVNNYKYIWYFYSLIFYLSLHLFQSPSLFHYFALLYFICFLFLVLPLSSFVYFNQSKLFLFDSFSFDILQNENGKPHGNVKIREREKVFNFDHYQKVHTLNCYCNVHKIRSFL